MSDSRQVHELARQIEELRLLVMQRGPQLGKSSIESGSIGEYDSTGQLVARYGRQWDGTHTAASLTGPIPPTPAGISGTPVPVGIKASWNGSWAEGPTVVAPSDFTRVEVHVSTDPNLEGFGILFSTYRKSIESPRGGEVDLIGLESDTDYYLCFTARTQSGKFSAPSAVVGPIRTGKIEPEDLTIDLSQIGGNTIHRGSTEPTGTHKIGDLWLQTPQNVPYRWEGDPGDWVESRDAGIAEALQDAFDADAKAVQAGIDALAAKNLANGKITVYRQASAPSGGTYLANADLWIDSDDNKLHIATTSAGAWTAVQDTAIQSAVSAAATAQAIADGKMRIFAQTSAPTGLTAGDVGDMWIDTGNGNRANVWGTSDTVERTNLVPNPRVQNNTTGWGVNPAAGAVVVLSHQASGGPTGGGFARGTWTTAPTVSGYATRADGRTTGGAMAAVAGQVYSASIYARASVAQKISCYLFFVNASNLVIGSAIVGPSVDMSANTWTRLVVEGATAPAGTVNAIVGAYTVSGTALLPTGGTLDATMAQLEPAATVTSYFDGASGGEAIWLGAPHASGSRIWQSATGALGWKPHLLRSGAIQPQSLVASDIIATGTVTAALLEAFMVLANTIVGGDPEGDHATLSEAGLRIFSLDPDGVVVESGSFGGSGTDRFLIIDPATGGTLASIGPAGASFPSVTTDTLVVGGNTFDYLFDRSPRGLIARGGANTGFGNTTSASGTYDVEFLAEPGRAYSIETTALNLNPSTTTTYVYAALVARKSSDGPTLTSSGILEAQRGSTNIAGGIVPITLSRTVSFDEIFAAIGIASPSVPTLVRIGLVYGIISGGGTVSIFGNVQYPVHTYIYDVGVERPFTGVLNLGGGTAPPMITQYQTDFAATWGANWTGGSNSPRTGSSDLIQGYSPYYPAGGSGIGQIGFGNFAATLAGSTIHWAALYVYTPHWHYDAGGTIMLGAHAYASPPGSKPADWQLDATRSGGHPKGGGGWIYLPSSWFGGLASGATKGFTFGDGSTTDPTFYGRIVAAPTDNRRPVLRVNYSK